jgi:hypothetical protein
MLLARLPETLTLGAIESDIYEKRHLNSENESRVVTGLPSWRLNNGAETNCLFIWLWRNIRMEVTNYL